MSRDPDPKRAPLKALPPEWRALEPLLDRILDADRAQRPALLDELSAGDATRREALEQLVAECEVVAPLLDRSAAALYPELAEGDDAPRIPALLAERYQTGRQLGAGGMARVYLARDIKHGRDVAIKVIRAELAASLGRERFLREIAIAAGLRHPNIVPLYDSGEAEGTLYFVMPYEEGPSLRERLARVGALAIPEAVSVLRDVARALQYAHERGVVHRDIKPDNVMMSGGAAVVTDFGIAKAVSAAQAEGGTGTTGALTQTGTGIGTPAYTAPEQAVGDPSSDHRADIYSFGCLAYEVLTGAPPFKGMPLHQVVAAHMTVVPPLVSDVRGEVSAALGDMVARCLAKDPEARLQNAGEILGILEGGLVASATSVLPPAEVSPRPTTAPSPVASPPANSSPPRPRRVRWALAAAVVAVSALGAYFLRGPGATATPITIAVLPFGNIGGDTAIAPFADGLGDEVFAALARVPGLQMRSRSGARTYRGQLGVDPSEVGRKLKVDYLVTGVLRESRGHWVLSTELTRTADAAELWTETFERAPDQQIGVAEEIARGAVNVLRRSFPHSLGEAPAPAASQQTQNAEAYRLYVLGQELLRRRGQSVKESAEAFRQAIRLDPTYAGAYAGLSMALALSPFFQGRLPSQDFQELSSSAARALQLDSTLAQPHVAMGMAYQYAYDWVRSDAEFRMALKRSPDDVEGHVQYGRHLLFRGMLREGLQQFQLARRADPASAVVLGWTSYAYYLLGARDSALVVNRQARQADSTSFTTNDFGAVIFLSGGELDSARALIKHQQHLRANLYFLALIGDTALAWSGVRQVESQPGGFSQAHEMRASMYLVLGDTAQALTELERATDAREIWPTAAPLTDPKFDGIRGSARLAALMKRVGLPTSAASIALRRKQR